MESKKFQRTMEDFVCEHCGASVAGSGYTDHCPKCLWSKHVDINPGDRAATCLGTMEPIRVEGSSPNYRIVYRCTRCGYEHRVNASADDSTQALIALASAL